MNDLIVKILSNNTLKVIGLLSKREGHLREIAAVLRISPSATHTALKKLLKINFVKAARKGNRKVFSLNQAALLLRKVKSLVNLDSILSLKAYAELGRMGSVGIYGSFAEGTNDEHSDLDLWVYGEGLDPAKVSGISSLFEKALKVETGILILNKNKLANLKNKDPEFYSRLKFTSVFTGGELFE